MARAFAKVKGTVWGDDDWKQLDPVEQWAYVLLLSQPQINNCGVLPYVVTRWARLAKGLTIDAVNDLMDRLEEARFIVVDHETAEVLVRTFIKHDEVEKQPNLVKAARRQYHEIQSPRIRLALATEYPHLFDTTTNGREPLETDNLKGLSEPLPKDLPEGVSNPRARARDLHLHGKPSPQQQTAPHTSAADAAAENPDLRAQLEALGWKDWQINRGLTDTARATAIADAALDQHAAGGIDNPGGWAWAEFAAGNTPTAPQTTLAPGALGATRSAKPPKLPFECNHELTPGVHCGSTFKTQERLTEHVADCHTELERAPIPPAMKALLDRATPEPTEPPPPPRRPAPTLDPRPTP